MNFIITTITTYAHELPIWLFVFVGSFFEEIFPPIPAFLTMILTGSLARIQGYELYALLPLVLISAGGKTLGSIVVYEVVDRAENVFMKKFGHLFNLTDSSLEKFGRRFSQSWSDYAILISLRAIPLVPSTLVTVGSGLIALPRRLFVIATYIGTLFRDSVYIYIGYIGMKNFSNHSHFLYQAFSLKHVITGAILTLCCAVLYLAYKRR